MRFRGPLAQADHFECDGAVEAFLSRTVNYTLPTAADFLQQFVIAEVTEYCWRFDAFLSVCFLFAIASGVDAPDYRLVIEQSNTFKETGWANFICCVSRDSCSARSANGGGSLH
jgi:hypothetical protein